MSSKIPQLSNAPLNHDYHSTHINSLPHEISPHDSVYLEIAAAL